MLNHLSNTVADMVTDKLNEIDDIVFKKIILQKPKKPEFGHFATNFCFSLAKEMKKSPIDIATEYANIVSKLDFIESANAISGFVNIFLKQEFLNEISDDYLKNGFQAEKKNKKILLEYISANPTGPLHIGHARGAIGGYYIQKCGSFLGYEIDTEYYVNDAGKQMDLLGLSVWLRACESILSQEVEFPEDYYRGDYILDIANDIYEQDKDIIINKDLKKIADIAKSKVLDLIKDDLSKIDINFDYFVSEKSLYDKWDDTEKIIKDYCYKKDGKLWLETTKASDEKDRVVVREDGVPTYLAGDILYHKNKFERDYDTYINIWGADHHGYINRVKSAIKFLGFNEEKLEILLSQMVALLKDGKPYKMSKRKGNFILMEEVREEIGNDALKFIFLTKKFDTHLEFDVSSLKEQNSSNPIFYINYAHARVHSLLEKSKFNRDDIENHNFQNLSQESSNLLLFSLMLSETIENSFNQKAPNKLTDYLYELSSLFHSFYNANKFIDSENEKDYLKVSLIVAKSINIGLSMMGIEAKEKMY